MADILTIYQEVQINLTEERHRINTPRMFNQKQRDVLLHAINLFESGRIGDMVEHMQSEKTKKLFEYPVWEYLGEEFYDVIRNMTYGIVYKTKRAIINEALTDVAS
jgi:hypothetical protein